MILNGYEAIYLPRHHRAYDNGLVYQHILNAEKKLGRLLKDEEVVHHKDFNKLNNSIDNLIIFASKKDHTTFHNGNNNGIYFNDEGIAFCDSIKNFCTDCGIEISSRATRCNKCYNNLKRNKNYPTKEELKNLIYNKSFIEIGKIYNVSDNAIRKWCDNYNLPRKKSIIKKYTLEEWEQI